MIEQTIVSAMDKSFNVVKKYIDEDGEVRLIKGKNFCMVSVVKQLSPGHEVHRQRGRLSVISAQEFFDVAVRYVRGEIDWTEPVREYSCKFNPKRSRACCAKNCPRKLGGMHIGICLEKVVCFDMGACARARVLYTE